MATRALPIPPREPNWTLVVDAVIYTTEMSTGATNRRYNQVYNDLYKWLKAMGRI